MNGKSKIADGLLVKQYQNGDFKALPLLVEKWHREFCNKAYWIVKDADMAKDIAQDCWKIVISKIKDLKDPDSFSSWALRIVYTKSLDWIKRDNRNKQKLNDYYHEQSFVEEEKEGNGNIKQKLLKAVHSLPEHQQTVIRLFYVQDYSLKEISAILDISIGTTKSRLFHAREQLKLTLKN